jgi:hypothetical protein
MTQLNLSLLTCFVVLLFFSCSKEIKLSKEKLFSTAQKADSSVQLILPNSLTEGVSCSDYTEGCLSAHTVKVKNLEMIAVEFTNEAQAIYASKKYRGFYVHNWFLDDVRGEPELEKFVQEGLGAKAP